MVYQDQRSDRHLLIDSYKENMVINQQSNKILLELKNVIENQTKSIESSYRSKINNNYDNE
jgi:hypothetical protein